ncbi:MAG: hypothetical protein ACI4TD_01070 [Phocaeicola sp.]
MITSIIASICAVCGIIAIALLYRLSKQQTEYIDIVTDTMYIQLQMIKFLSDAETSNLWKIRQEIYNWQCQWAAKDEYEAAQQAQQMIKHIEELIQIHANLTKEYEDNEGTNE